MRYPTQINNANFPELIKIINDESNELKRIASNCAYCSCDKEIQELLSAESLQQFLAISNAIAIPLKDIDFDSTTTFGFEDDIEEQSRIMQCWITLGSAIESALQIFLAIYLQDYQSSNWHKWVNFNESIVKIELIKTIDQLGDNGDLDRDQVRSLKGVIKDELKARRDIPPLKKVMLFDLIEFYRAEVKWEKDKIDKLNEIREYRNCIHAFIPRQLGEWDKLKDSLKFYCCLLLDLQTMAPDCDEFLAIEAQLDAEIDGYYRSYEE